MESFVIAFLAICAELYLQFVVEKPFDPVFWMVLACFCSLQGILMEVKHVLVRLP
jgi:hypothetical protein